jgi:hypothetical protein
MLPPIVAPMGYIVAFRERCAFDDEHRKCPIAYQSALFDAKSPRDHGTPID